MALAVLSIGLLAAFRLQALDLGLIRAERNTTRACLAAESLMWTWTAQGFASSGAEGNLIQGTWEEFRYQARLDPGAGLSGLDSITLSLEDAAGDQPRLEFQRLEPGLGAE